ncbi:MAG TPA: hypothetical protein VIA18_04480, partial [Polyangia bacterium]|nr:hypothetical protein [Polyangia bacterium]
TLTVLLAGCTGDLVELGPKTSTSSADMAMAGGSAGGGGTAGGDMTTGSSGPVTFASIQADLDSKTCSVSCHNATAGAALNGGFILVPHATSAADLATSYAAVQGEINTTTPAMSLLLTNPAGLATPPHTGGMLFTGGTSDPTYVKWLAWITAGAPQ